MYVSIPPKSPNPAHVPNLSLPQQLRQKSSSANQTKGLYLPTLILVKAQQTFQDILRFVRDLDLDYLGFANASEEVTVEILNGIDYGGNKLERTNLRLALDHSL